MTAAAFRQVSPELKVLSAELEDQIKSAKSFDDIRNLSTQHSLLVTPLAQAIFNIHLLGRAQIYADVIESRAKIAKGLELSAESRPLALSSKLSTILALSSNLSLRSALLGAVVTDVTFEPLPFQEAIDFFRRKLNLTPAQYAALSDAARAKAFTIAAGASRQVTGSINDLLDRALSDGLTLREFQSQAADVLDSAGVSERTPWYWETVYRTNLQTSYQVGRWKQMTDPAVVAERPYLRYVSARLPTSRPDHVDKHGLIYPVGDPFWAEWYPPNGFNCLCTVVSVAQSELAEFGWKLSTRSDWAPPDEGFDNNPGMSEAA